MKHLFFGKSGMAANVTARIYSDKQKTHSAHARLFHEELKAIRL